MTSRSRWFSATVARTATRRLYFAGQPNVRHLTYAGRDIHSCVMPESFRLPPAAERLDHEQIRKHAAEARTQSAQLRAYAKLLVGQASPEERARRRHLL